MLVGYSEIINKQRKKVVIIRLSNILDIFRIVIDSIPQITYTLIDAKKTLQSFKPLEIKL